MKAGILMKCVIVSYIITGLLLFMTAFLLYKLEPEQSMVSAGILLIYLLSCFLGGMLAGKKIRNRKFFWGMLTGALYFVLLLAVSLIGYGKIQSPILQIFTALLLCAGGGMLGGMAA